MPRVKIKGYPLNADYAGIKHYPGGHGVAWKPPLNEPLYFTSAEGMPKYNRLIIERLALMYDGVELEERLRKLQFCSYETAIEVLEKRSDNGK